MFKKIIFILMSVWILSACERDVVDSNSGKVTIQWPVPTQIQKDISKITIFGAGSAPLTWSDADCIAFMVDGPEASLRQNRCEIINGRTGIAESSDFYFGPTVGGFYMNEPAEIEIASGSGRTITAIGFKTNWTAAIGADSACKNVLTQDNKFFSKPFVLAKSEQLKIEPGSTQSVLMPITYSVDSTPFLGDCFGPTAPGGKGGGTEDPPGPPVKVKMRVQDNLTSAVNGSCVMVAFDLLDANDRLATVTEDFDFSLQEVGGTKAKFGSIVNYCDGTLGYSFALQFYSVGGARTNRIILAMKPDFTDTINFALTQSSGTTLSQDLVSNFVVVAAALPSLNPPFTINVFDVKNFRSSRSTSASDPIEVKSDDCMAAIVQVLDNVGRPLKVWNVGPSAGNYMTSTVTSQSLDGGNVRFSTNPSCTPTFASDIVSYDYDLGSPTGFNRMFLKVPTGLNGKHFNLNVLVNGSGYYDLSNDFIDLNPMSANNFRSFWKIK